jgi:hypothetical protein
MAFLRRAEDPIKWKSSKVEKFKVEKFKVESESSNQVSAT